jgi:hypothetical protein
MGRDFKGDFSMARQYVGLSLLLCAALAAPAGAFAQAAEKASPVRIGVVLPKAQLGQGNAGQDVANPVRQLIMSYMAGPVLELVALEARIPAQIEAEARALNCTHVLYTSVEQKKGRGGAGGLLSKMGPMAGMLPGVGALGGAAAGVAAGVATQAIMTAASASMQQQAMDSLMQVQAGSVKAKDEITLQYQFVTMGGGKPALEDSLKAKAAQDGQDLLSPLVEQLATAAVTAALQP